MSTTHIQANIVQFLANATGQAVDATTDLQSTELIDSLTMMDLLVYIESDFGVRLDFEDLTPEAFQSPMTLSRLIESRVVRRAG